MGYSVEDTTIKKKNYDEIIVTNHPGYFITFFDGITFDSIIWNLNNPFPLLSQAQLDAEILVDYNNRVTEANNTLILHELAIAYTSMPGNVGIVLRNIDNTFTVTTVDAFLSTVNNRIDLEVERAQLAETILQSNINIKNTVKGNVGQLSGNTQIPYGNNTILANAGTQIWSANITPVKVGNNIAIDFSTLVQASISSKTITIAIFRDNILIGFSTCGATGSTGNRPTPISIKINDPVLALTPIIYSCRIGIDSGTWYLGRGKDATMGGINNSGWSVTEEL